MQMKRRSFTTGLLASAAAFTAIGKPVLATVNVAYRQAIAEGANGNKKILEFYQARGFNGIWTNAEDLPRRQALATAMAQAYEHALPRSLYNTDKLISILSDISSDRARGMAEVKTTKLFLAYAHDMESGILDPDPLGDEFGVKPPRRDPLDHLNGLMAGDPGGFIRGLTPSAPAYAALRKERMRLEGLIAAGGWGDAVRAKKIEPGDAGAEVIALRNRLVRMGYMRPSAATAYDGAVQDAVLKFQSDHGLITDGVAGASTIEAINEPPETRLRQVVIGLERQRWMNKDLGWRHIFVNQADFKAWFIEDGSPIFETAVVVGQSPVKHQTTEFSDLMTHLIVNPSWHVPESIMVNEYLPDLQRNPAALSREGIILSDAQGPVDPGAIDWNSVSGSNWGFSMRQPPGASNALGEVKFMFPNKYNIYMHDTPAKSLFAKEFRAYSHGCVRVQKPRDFAYLLLGFQSSNPQGLFHSVLATREETQIDLVNPFPVHLTYQTAWMSPEGRMNYRRDTYGRDAKVFAALQNVGVEVDALSS